MAYIDTVVVCDRCGRETRFSYDPMEDEADPEAAYEAWLDECCVTVNEECGCDEETTDA